MGAESIHPGGRLGDTAPPPAQNSMERVPTMGRKVTWGVQGSLSSENHDDLSLRCCACFLIF